jgi:predicted membrane-bound spermidine synthase
MHVCLLIDLLTLGFLIHGIRTENSPSRRLLCLACLLYLLTVGLHYYFVFAPWFGLFRPHPSIYLIAMLNFFGGFWTFFGVMVLVKGVSYIALAFMVYNLACLLNRPKTEPQRLPLPMGPTPPEAERPIRSL